MIVFAGYVFPKWAGGLS